MNSRLTELHAMKARIEQEIAREEAFMRRMGRLRDLSHELLAKQSPTVRATLVAVSDEYDLTVVDLMSRRRFPEVAAARHVAAAVLRRQGFSFPEVGRLIDRDHATVMHSCRRVEDCPDLAAVVERVELRLADEFAADTTARPNLVAL